MTEASNRIDYLASDSAPYQADIHNDYFRIPNTQEVLSVHATQSVVWMDNTLLYRKVESNAQQRPISRQSTIPHNRKPSLIILVGVDGLRQTALRRGKIPAATSKLCMFLLRTPRARQQRA